jgi:ATP-binding cassette subfamily B (MDR/TAP) protein 1
MMAKPSEGKLQPLAPPPTTSSESETAAQEIKIGEVATTTKDRNSATAKEEEHATLRQKRLPQAGLANYFRVLSYGTKFDYSMMSVCVITSVGSGATMSLMIIVFGGLISDITNFSIPEATATEREFQSLLNKQALYLVYLFIGKFVLSYASMV